MARAGPCLFPGSNHQRQALGKGVLAPALSWSTSTTIRGPRRTKRAARGGRGPRPGWSRGSAEALGRLTRDGVRSRAAASPPGIPTRRSPMVEDSSILIRTSPRERRPVDVTLPGRVRDRGLCCRGLCDRRIGGEHNARRPARAAENGEQPRNLAEAFGLGRGGDIAALGRDGHRRHARAGVEGTRPGSPDTARDLRASVRLVLGLLWGSPCRGPDDQILGRPAVGGLFCRR